MSPTIVIWGAGRIGRGFVADLFADAGYRIVFVDQAEALVADLRGEGSTRSCTQTVTSDETEPSGDSIPFQRRRPPRSPLPSQPRT